MTLLRGSTGYKKRIQDMKVLIDEVKAKSIPDLPWPSSIPSPAPIVATVPASVTIVHALPWPSSTPPYDPIREARLERIRQRRAGHDLVLEARLERRRKARRANRDAVNKRMKEWRKAKKINAAKAVRESIAQRELDSRATLARVTALCDAKLAAQRVDIAAASPSAVRSTSPSHDGATA